MIDHSTIIEEGTTVLPNGCTLYWSTNELGNRRYSSDEIGCGVVVWDTTLVDLSTLIGAINNELTLQTYERHIREKK